MTTQNEYPDLIKLDHTHPFSVCSIAQFHLGIAIRGDISPELLSSLSDTFLKFYGYDSFDAIIAEHFEASFVFTSVSKAEKWRKELGINNENFPSSIAPN